MNKPPMKSLLLFFIITIFTPNLLAAKILQLNLSDGKYPIGKYISVLEDGSGKLTIDDIRKPQYANQYKTFSEDTPLLGYSRSVFWVRLQIKNNSSQGEWLLEQGYASTHYLDMYVTDKDGNILHVKESGSLRPYHTRDVAHQRIIFRLHLNTGESRVIYLRMKNQSAITFDFIIWPKPTFDFIDHIESFAMGLFYGLFVAILVVNLFMYLFFRKRDYLYLVLFIASAGATYSFSDGYAQILFSADNVESSRHFIPMLLSLSVISLVQYGHSLMSAVIQNRMVKRIHIALLITWSFLFLMEPVADYLTTITIVLPAATITLLYLMLVGILDWKLKNTPVRFFVLGLFAFFMGFFGMVIDRFGYSGNHFIFNNGLRIGLIILLLFMTLAIVDHIQWLQKTSKRMSKALLISENKFSAIIDHTFQLIGLLSPEGRVLEVNKAALKFGNLSRQEVSGKYLWEIGRFAHNPVLQEQLRIAIKKAAAGEFIRMEIALPFPNGQKVWLDASLKPYKDKNGKVITLIPEARDITEIKRSQQAINEMAIAVSAQTGETFFKQLVLSLAKTFNADHAFIGLLDDNDKNIINTLIVSSHGEIVGNLSYPLEGTPCAKVVGQEICAYTGDVQTAFPKDSLLTTMDAQSYIGTPMNYSNGEPIGLIVVISSSPMAHIELATEMLKIFSSRAAAEIERSAADEKLHYTKKKLALHVKQTPLGVIEWNTKFEVIDWNPAAEDIFSYSFDEAKGRNAADLIIPPSAKEHIEAVWSALLENKGGTRSTNENLTKDRRIIICEWYNTPLIADDGTVIGVASIVQDITAMHHTQQKRQQKESEQRDILNAMADAVITIDSSKTILSVNKAAKFMFGYADENPTGKNIKFLVPAIFIKRYTNYIQRYINSGETSIVDVGGDIPGLRKDQSTFPMRLSIAQLTNDIHGRHRFICFFQDLTQHKEQEDRLRRSQRMDSLGNLTGGIAHDYNNMLGVILGYSDLLKDALKDQPSLVKYTEQIHHAGERGAQLTRKLLAFSRKKNTDAEQVNINKLLREEQNMLEKTLTASIKLVFNLDKQLWPIWVDAGDLEDAIINMCINAMHAMDGKGELTIETANKHNCEEVLPKLGQGKSDYVMLSISDVGRGMDKAIKDRIFEPFYSTKGEKGTGLGLSQVYGFIERSDGTIHVDSLPGLGTQFMLYFPIHHGETNKEKTLGLTTITDLRGKETILVVDDEAALLDLLSEFLNPPGYHVICSSNAKQALQIMESEPVDLLLSDVIMPEMNGYQLAAIVRKKYPSVKIQLVSGYSDDHHIDMIDSDLQNNLLHKPYQQIALLERIRELLDS